MPRVLADTRRGSAIVLDHLEMWVRDLDATRRLMTGSFGFTAIEGGRERDVLVDRLVLGGITLILRQATSPMLPVARHVARHGDGVADVALAAEEAGAAAQRARARGLPVVDRDGRLTIDMTGDGTIRHTIRTTISARGAQVVRPHSSLPRAVDHVAYCLPAGSIERVAANYVDVLALERLDDRAWDGPHDNGMRSIVLRSRPGFTVVLTEPTSVGGQTQRFLDAHAGPGTQHVALACDDICATVATLRANGVRFLPAPGEYHDEARRRLGDPGIPWEDLRRADVLVDADDGGLLFQIFTRPLTDRGTFFIEIIQRAGATGFGANNVRALYAAVELAADTDRPEDQ